MDHHVDDLVDAGTEAPEEGCTYLAVVEKGKTFTYVVPSFPVYKAELQEIKLQYTDSKGDPQVFDGLARKCDLMDHPLPALARLPHSYENAFVVKVSY